MLRRQSKTRTQAAPGGADQTGETIIIGSQFYLALSTGKTQRPLSDRFGCRRVSRLISQFDKSETKGKSRMIGRHGHYAVRPASTIRSSKIVLPRPAATIRMAVAAFEPGIANAKDDPEQFPRSEHE